VRSKKAQGLHPAGNAKSIRFFCVNTHFLRLQKYKKLLHVIVLIKKSALDELILTIVTHVVRIWKYCFTDKKVFATTSVPALAFTSYLVEFLDVSGTNPQGVLGFRGKVKHGGVVVGVGDECGGHGCVNCLCFFRKVIINNYIVKPLCSVWYRCCIYNILPIRSLISKSSLMLFMNALATFPLKISFIVSISHQ